MPAIDQTALEQAIEHHRNCDDCTECECSDCHCCTQSPYRAGLNITGGSCQQEPELESRGVDFISPRSRDRQIFHKPGKAQLVRNPSRRYAALEIEVARVEVGTGHIESAVRRWSAAIVEDGSLPDTGFEINVAPAAGDLLLDQIRDISDALASQAASVDTTCGLHVHVDCRDFTYYDLRRLVFLYEKIEPALFAMVPKSRRTSTYCHPCGTQYADAIRQSRIPKDSKKNLISGIYGNARYANKQRDDESAKATIQDAKYSRYTEARYNALNLHSWFYRGTIECRIAAGTTDYDKLANWALLWVSIVDSAYRMSEPEILKMTCAPYEMLLRLAPNETVRTWIENRTRMFSRYGAEKDS